MLPWSSSSRFPPGFSLLEVLLSLSLITLVSAGLFTFLTANQFGAGISIEESMAMSRAQEALRRVVTELRPAVAVTAPEHPAGLRIVSPTGVAVEYYQEGNALKRRARVGAEEQVATGLALRTGFQVTYRDAGWNRIPEIIGAAAYSRVAAVEVSVSIAGAIGVAVTRTTCVALRNRPGRSSGAW